MSSVTSNITTKEALAFKPFIWYLPYSCKTSKQIMASDNIEIEIRFPVEENIFLEVEEKLKNAKFVKETYQIDEYFIPPHRNFLECNFPFEWLSLRKRGGKVTLNYKHFYPPNAEIHTYCDEFETEIQEPIQLEKILSALNFEKIISVEKNRKVYSYNNEFEVCLDKVGQLGYFIEVEAINNYEGVEKTREKIMDFSKSLGIDISNTDEGGYAALLLKKRKEMEK